MLFGRHGAMEIGIEQERGIERKIREKTRTGIKVKQDCEKKNRLGSWILT